MFFGPVTGGNVKNMYAIKLHRQGDRRNGKFVHTYFRTYVSLRIASRFKTFGDAQKECGLDEQVVKIDLMWVEVE